MSEPNPDKLRALVEDYGKEVARRYELDAEVESLRAKCSALEGEREAFAARLAMLSEAIRGYYHGDGDSRFDAALAITQAEVDAFVREKRIEGARVGAHGPYPDTSLPEDNGTLARWVDRRWPPKGTT